MSMASSGQGDFIVAELVMDEATANLLLRHAVLQTQSPEDEGLPSVARGTYFTRKFWNRHDTVRYQVPKAGWRPYVGGIAINVRVGDYSGFVTRAVATFKDKNISDLVLKQDSTRKRGAITLEEVNGIWYAHMRFSNFRRVRRRVSVNYRKDAERKGVTDIITTKEKERAKIQALTSLPSTGPRDRYPRITGRTDRPA